MTDLPFSASQVEAAAAALLERHYPNAIWQRQARRVRTIFRQDVHAALSAVSGDVQALIDTAREVAEKTPSHERRETLRSALARFENP